MDTETFLTELFGGHTGYIYAPRKTPHSFDKKWYLWPQNKTDLTNDLHKYSPIADCYLSPVLWKDTTLDPQSFKLSQVVWCDFDNGTPDELGDFPKPALQVSSSDRPTKQHWYWKLRNPIDNPRVLEQWNRRVAYALGADKGCWNFGRVLRPIRTLNHKYSPPAPVSLVKVAHDLVDKHIFSALPDSGIHDRDADYFTYRILDVPSIIAEKPWKTEAWDFFTSPKEDGERHTALTSVAITCVEMGMSRDETMTFLYDADTRWRKYIGRQDRDKRLRAICLYAEQIAQRRTGNQGGSLQELPLSLRDGSKSKEHDAPTGQEPEPRGPQSFTRFVRHQYHVDWIVEDLIHSQGLAVVAAPPGIGKTQFSLNMALSVSAGHPFLGWQVTRPRKVLFLSLEMMQPELKYYLDKMAAEFNQEERELFDKNCFFLAKQAFRLNSEANQKKLLQWIDETGAEGIFIDSLSRCTGGDLEKGEIDAVFDFLNEEVRDKRKCFVWFVHHNRKANFNQKQPKKLEDLYGSQYIGAYASTVIGLWKITQHEIEVNCLKIWLSSPFPSMIIDRTPNLTFTTRKTIDVA